MISGLRARRGLQRLVSQPQTELFAAWSEHAANAISVRTGLTVRINNPRDTTRELNKLFRKCRSEKLHKYWRRQEFYTPPSEQRILDEKETQKRIRKQNFKEAMEWVNKRKARGF